MAGRHKACRLSVSHLTHFLSVDPVYPPFPATQVIYSQFWILAIPSLLEY